MNFTVVFAPKSWEATGLPCLILELQNEIYGNFLTSGYSTIYLTSQTVTDGTRVPPFLGQKEFLSIPKIWNGWNGPVLPRIVRMFKPLFYLSVRSRMEHL